MDFWSVTAFQALLRCSRSLNLSDNDACCGPGAEGMNPIVRAEMKRAALVQLARGEPPQKLQAVVDFISSTLLRSHPEQHISGQPVAKAWDRVPPPRPTSPPPSCPAPQRPALIYNYYASFGIWLKKKRCLLFEGTNGEIITFLIRPILFQS